MPKGSFRNAKEALSQCQRVHFASQKEPFCDTRGFLSQTGCIVYAMKHDTMFTVKKILPILILAFAAMPMFAADVVVTVRNTLNQQRQEVVEVDAATVKELLSVDDGSRLVVCNALSQEVASQLTHDGKLLFEVSVRPNATATFTIKTGVRHTYTSYVGGNVYPKRLDDLTFENDRAIYRMYGAALQRTGERSFGIDVWTKSTPYLDAKNRYEAEFALRDTINALRKAGDKASADSLNVLVSYHIDHGTGLDAYAVGATLGCGAPALMPEGRLKMPYCWQQCSILDNGPLRFTAHLIYNKSRVGSDDDVVEHRMVSLDKGSNFCKMTVWYDGLRHECDLATGVVVHSSDTTSILLGDDCVLYADPTDRPLQLNCQLYVGTLYPFGNVKPAFLCDNTIAKDVAGHAVGITKYKPNERFTYFFGAAWSAADVRSWEEWQLVSRQFITAQQSPLVVSVQKDDTFAQCDYSTQASKRLHIDNHRHSPWSIMKACMPVPAGTVRRKMNRLWGCAVPHGTDARFRLAFHGLRPRLSSYSHFVAYPSLQGVI